MEKISGVEIAEMSQLVSFLKTLQTDSKVADINADELIISPINLVSFVIQKCVYYEHSV